MRRRLLRSGIAFVAAASLALAAGCEGRRFSSPSDAQGPPAFTGSPVAQQGPDPSLAIARESAGATPSPSPVFVKAEDSNAWVAQTFVVQPKYARVLVVASGPAPEKVTVPALDLNRRPGEVGAPVEYPVAASFPTIQDAIAAAHGGDLVAVMPGHHVGFAIVGGGDNGDGRYLHVKAMGRPGEVVVDRPNAVDKNWMILLRRAHHVIVEGFAVAGANDDAGSSPSGPNAGIFLDGDFGRSGVLTHHVAIVDVFSHHHRMWGLHSTDTHSVLIQDSLFAFSAWEHGAYVSDGSDDYVIRRNVFFKNRASGLQCNVDPLASFEETLTHPAMQASAPMKQTRAWAEATLAAATARFGADNFPDGRGKNFLIEGNVMNENGARGGAALNLAGVRDSILQNNLAYDNAASGIVLWDNENPFDAALVEHPPKSPAEAEAATGIPLFGCSNDVVRGNTILGKTRGRPALMIGNGSVGTRAHDNVLVNETSPSIELMATGIAKTDAGANVSGDVSLAAGAAALAPAAIHLPGGKPVGEKELAGEFVKPGGAPWVVIEGGWWHPNPARPDFRPKKGSRLLGGRAERSYLPPMDLLGKKRDTADIGALAQ